VHFRTAWLSFADIGWRSVAAALSDLAADGAEPIGVVVSLGVPGKGRGRGKGEGDPAAEIMAGVGAAARRVGAHVLGGDLVRSDRYLVDVCVLGWTVRPVRRHGARPGDGVWVTGALGGAQLALQALAAGRRPPPGLFRRFARPVPRIAAGRRLAALGARAMIDVSDGLAVEQVPRFRSVPGHVAVASGEEFELLVALPPRFTDRDARSFRVATRVPLTRIGRCVRGSGVRLTDHGRAIAAPKGFDHFPAG